MRNMSFFLTTAQIRARTKWVTRRLGWADLKPGELVQGILKGQGIPKGGKIEKLDVIRCVSNTASVLNTITAEECVAEGFPGMTPGQFVAMFCEANGCREDAGVNRIEFRYEEPRNPLRYARCRSVAKWPPGHIFKRYGNDITSDTHADLAAAVCVCSRLRHEGLGGERIHFPVSTWVEEFLYARELPGGGFEPVYIPCVPALGVSDDVQAEIYAFQRVRG
jgi:hypothetical protein